MNRQSKQTRTIQDQTSAEKMYLLKQVAQQILGPKWRFFSKLRQAGEQLLQKHTRSAESLNATRSALRYTAKTAKSAYSLAYQSCVKDICAFTEHEKADYPGFEHQEATKEIPTLSDQQDADIITWTPIKFMLPVKQIQEKGSATKRHTEGLSAKLIFKVVAFYSVPENWKLDRLTLYLQHLSIESTNDEVHRALDPLRKDLLSFMSVIETLRFDQVGLNEERSSLENALDTNLGIGTTEYLARIMYWYDFIFEALELFVFRYFLVLVTASPCAFAIKRLAILVEPVLSKAIEIRSYFLNTLEGDNAINSLGKSLEQIKQKNSNQSNVRKIKTIKGEFETFNFNSKLLESKALQFDIQSKPDVTSEWGSFIKFKLLGIKQEKADREVESSIIRDQTEVMEQAAMQILSTIAKANQHKQAALQKIITKFKEDLIEAVQTTRLKVNERKNEVDEQISQMESDFLRLKIAGDRKANDIQKQIEHLRIQVDKQNKALKRDTKNRLNAQKESLKKISRRLSNFHSIHAGVAANIIYKLTEEFDTSGEFGKEFIRFVINNISSDYSTHLTPFYENAFRIMEPSTHEKVAIIQSLKKSGIESAFGLTLDEEESKQFQKLIRNLRLKIDKAYPHAFDSSILFSGELLPLETLLKIGIDNDSLNTLLRMKVVTSKQPMAHHLQPATIKLIQFLNTIINPVPIHSLILEGKENTRNSQSAINTALLKKLMLS